MISVGVAQVAGKYPGDKKILTGYEKIFRGVAHQEFISSELAQFMQNGHYNTSN